MFVGALTKLNLALVLALCFANSATATLNMNNICLLVGDGYSIASEDSCSNYYYCNNGIATMETCPSSLYFSKEQQNCISPSQVNCIAAGDVPCAGRQVGTWAAMANSCSGYYYCGANGPLAGYCPGNENFDAVSQSCQYDTVVGCSAIGGGSSDNLGGGVTISINLCNFIQNSVYFGSPSDCTGWNTCNNNIMSSGSCSNNLVFNVHKRTCDYASNWSCSQVTHDPNLVNSTATTGGSCTAQDPQKKNTTLCDSYYLCVGTTYQLTQCPTGLYFDTISNLCVDRMDAHNNCDRCEGTTKAFVNAYSTQNCTGYLSCLNGVQQSSGTCPSGYFDEEAGACLVGDVTEPAYACCNPNPNGTPPTTIAGSTCTTTLNGGDCTTAETSTPEATTSETTTPETTTPETTTPEPTTIN